MRMHRRTVGIFSAMVLAMTLLLFRLGAIIQGDGLSQAALRQSSYLLEVGSTRGMIYDRNFQPLVGETVEAVAAVLPGEESAALAGNLSGEEREAFTQKLAQRLPFLTRLPGELRSFPAGVTPMERILRYRKSGQLAPHVIGYLDGENGAAGIEKAYDSLLKQFGGSLCLRYQINAAGSPIGGELPQEVQEGYGRPGGVVLTLDKEIQSIAQSAAKRWIDKGAVVVMDVRSGDLLAVVSLPDFDPNNLSKSMAQKDSPFFNRAFHGEYNVGSTFKLVTASTALEQGISRFRTFDCTGAVEVEDVTFHCHKLSGHGVLDMQGAMEWSCNPYFITLGQMAGGENILKKAQAIGFGSPSQLAPGIATASGSLPALEAMESPAEVANLSFGQGKLTATPVQIAQLVSTVANGGKSVHPRLVYGTTEDGLSIQNQEEGYAQNQVISPAAAKRVAQFMVDTVEYGSGQKAKPKAGGAGGKTASAQTGIYEDGVEIVHAWFAGFYPAEEPQYTIVVLAEGMESGGDYAAPVFQEIADGIADYKGMDFPQPPASEEGES